jgi:mono/diheme cytochrome c family protein
MLVALPLNNEMADEVPMNGKKILLATGGFLGVIVVAAGAGATYINLGWDRARYSAYPLPDLHATTDSATIVKGRYLALGPAHCTDCHTLPGGAPYSGGVAFHFPLGTIYSPNITPDSATGIGSYSDGHHELTLLGKAIIRFVIKPNPRDNKAPQTAPPSTPSVERGEYLVNSVAECAGCHTLRDLRSGAFTGPHLGGGFEYPADTDPSIIFTPPNLTNDPTGMTGRLTEDQFVARFRLGRVIKESIMPWEAFLTMNEDDVRAIYRYIKTVPPVHNQVVPMRRKS